jgi:hypothetical protein
LASGSQCQIINTNSGWIKTLKLPANTSVRVTTTNLASSPSPPPGITYNNLINTTLKTYPANDEKKTVEFITEDETAAAQLGCHTVHSAKSH